ncbi:MAG: IMP dehydrogenase, partial [Ignavibacteria bacterium]|nr:IMP dehydrogenase [Ignavibacteria bacterium]
MKIYTKKDMNEFYQSLTYDDISLVPTEISRVKSRNEPITACEFLGAKLSLPILSSPMDTVTGLDMATELTDSGCLGILNRFDSSLANILSSEAGTEKIKSVSIGLNTDLSTIEKLASRKMIICLDTANASNQEVINKAEEVKKH